MFAFGSAACGGACWRACRHRWPPSRRRRARPACSRSRSAAQQAPPPLAQPPAGSGPVVLAINTCFDRQGGTSLIEPQTYVYYIKTKHSTPSQALWVPYNEEAEKTIHDDFQRLLATTFLDDLSIETEDYQFPNGTIGKVVVYHMEERQRIKLGPDYVGTKAIETSKIDEKLKEQNAEIRLDSFIDAGAGEKGRGHRPRHDEREGIRVRGGHAGNQGSAWRAEAGAPDVPH